MSNTKNKRMKTFEVSVYQKYVTSGLGTVETGFNCGGLVREIEGGRKTKGAKKEDRREGGTNGQIERGRKDETDRGREGTK